MIIFLYGSDSYRRLQKIKELTSVFKEKYPQGDIARFDLEDKPEEWEDLAAFFNQESMFYNRKMAIARGIFAIQKKEFLKFLKKQSETEGSTLIISEDKKPAKEFSFLLEPPIKSQEFEKLRSGKLSFFVRKECLARNISLSPFAERFFIEFVKDFYSSDSWGIVNELDKISLAGLRQPIELQDLKTVLNLNLREVIFSLVGKLSRKNLPALERLFLQKEEPAYIFNLLAYRASRDLLLKLADYDVSIKSGGLDYEEALLDLIL